MNSISHRKTPVAMLFSQHGICLDQSSGLYWNEQGELSINYEVLAMRGNLFSSSLQNSGSCNVSYSISPSKSVRNGIIQASFTGLQPQQNIIVLVDYPGGKYNWGLKADDTGSIINAPLKLEGPIGTYKFVPLVPNCIVAPEFTSVQVVDSLVGEPESCNGIVTVTPSFDILQAADNQQIVLTLTATNTNNNSINNLTVAPITLPTGLSSTTPVKITNLALGPRETKQLQFVLTTDNTTLINQTATVVIASGGGQYSCGTQTFAIAGGSAAIIILPPAPDQCSLVITSFSFTPSTIAQGGTTTCKLIVKNAGTNPLTGVTLAQIPLSDSQYTRVPANSNISMSGVNLAPGEEATISVDTTLTFTGTGTGQHINTVIIGANKITANCGGSVISNATPVAASVVVNN